MLTWFGWDRVAWRAAIWRRSLALLTPSTGQEPSLVARPVPELLFNIFLRWDAMASFQPASIFGVATRQVTTMFTLQELLSNGLQTRQSAAACYRILCRYRTVNGRVPNELHIFIDRHDSKLKQLVLCHRASGQPRAWTSSRANHGPEA